MFAGDTPAEAGQSTYCHACKVRLIGRDWYDLTLWNVTVDGRCGDCGTPYAGVFDRAPGRWGRPHRPLTVQANAAGA